MTAPSTVFEKKLPAKRIPELDGVRSIAIWMVLLAHGFYGFANHPQALDGMPKILQLVIGHGWLGVDLFFVLSGFLITGILLDSREEAGYFRRFYTRRALRILPVYYCSIVVMWLFYQDAGSYFKISLAFLANFARAFGIREPHGPGVFWSLAVEEHFYMVWPLLVFLLNRRVLALASLLIVAAEPIARGIFAARGMDIEGGIYSYSWFRFDGLALGAILAICFRSQRWNTKNAVRLACGLVAVAVLETIFTAPFGGLERGILGAAIRSSQAALSFAAFMCLALGYRATRATGWLATPFTRVSADLSYCIYLVHVAIGDGYEHVLRAFRISMSEWAGPSGAVLLRVGVVCLASFGVAALSRRVIELPALSLRHWLRAD